MSTRRARLASTSTSSTPTPATVPTRIPTLARPASADLPQLQELRRQWKWAAFSQFFYTFAPVFAMEDVSLTDIEEDLINSTMIFIPRVMQRMLISLSQDRKITTENWQTALRRQYLRRNPDANPIGWEPIISRNSRSATVETDLKSEPDVDSINDSGHNDENTENLVKDETLETKVISEENAAPVSSEEGREEKDFKDSKTLPNKKDELNDSSGSSSMKDWVDLAMLEKLESMHTIIEWHFQNPLRIRSIMRSDDENASWRIEPIGYDAKRNAYWLIGQDRLWIQRSPPRPPKKTTKRKATTNGGVRKAKVARVESAVAGDLGSTSQKRAIKRSTRVDIERNQGSSSQRNTRGSRSRIDEEMVLTPSKRGSRAAKTQANAKLDLQAKQLAAAKAEMDLLDRQAKSSPKRSSNRRSMGTRVSRRLRGDDGDDEWQQIPVEWLAGADEEEETEVLPKMRNTRSSTRPKPSPRDRVLFDRGKKQSKSLTSQKTGLESDDESDLTELSESEETNPAVEASVVSPYLKQQEGSRSKDSENEESGEAWPPSDFVEWETICVSLQEWESIPQKFEKATHYLEKALFKFLINEIVPYVSETLREIETLRQKEEALMNRKRSSRLAIRESEKEAARLAAEKMAEEEEKMARARRLEARARREEEERLKQEQAREQRRREREARELARSRRLEESGDNEDKLSVPHELESKQSSAPKESAKQNLNQPLRKLSNKQKLVNEDWELDCEICGAKGINKDDGLPIMSCEKCGKWQHIPCHDAIIRKAGKKARNWDTVDFICKQCSLADVTNPHKALNTSHIANGHNPYLGQSPSYYSSPPTHRQDEIIPANSRKTVNYSHEQGPSAFAGFAHYHPQQRGFSAHPTVQTQYPSHNLSHPSLSQHSFQGQRIHPNWTDRASQPYPNNGTLTYQHHLPYMTSVPVVASGNSNVQHLNNTQQPLQNGQYQHVVPIHTQLHTINNQTSHHTQV